MRILGVIAAILVWAVTSVAIETRLGWNGKPEHLIVDIGVAVAMLAIFAIGNAIVKARTPQDTVRHPFE